MFWRVNCGKEKKKNDTRTTRGSCRTVRLAREKKGPAQYKNVAKNVLALPDDHYLSYKSVKNG